MHCFIKGHAFSSSPFRCNWLVLLSALPSAMGVRLRLQRLGRRKVPFYRIVAADHKSPRDGRHLDVLGDYDPVPSALPPLSELICVAMRGHCSFMQEFSVQRRMATSTSAWTWIVSGGGNLLATMALMSVGRRSPLVFEKMPAAKVQQVLALCRGATDRDCEQAVRASRPPPPPAAEARPLP